jgi:hypothetical protein
MPARSVGTVATLGVRSLSFSDLKRDKRRLAEGRARRRRSGHEFVWHGCKIDNIVSLPENLDEFIAAAGWRFASSMPDIPHEYTVRGKATAGVDPPPVEWHDWFVEQVRRHGTATRASGASERSSTSSTPAGSSGSSARSSTASD